MSLLPNLINASRLYQLLSNSGSASSRPSRRGSTPAEIRKKLGLKKGDLVAFVETEQGVLLSPQEVIASEALDQVGRILREKGLTLEELMESGREIRGKLVEEEYGPEAEE
jgi:AbrB family looped-hinge helix DNA binding protein